jgi:hypothetical protein
LPELEPEPEPEPELAVELEPDELLVPEPDKLVVAADPVLEVCVEVVAAATSLVALRARAGSCPETSCIKITVHRATNIAIALATIRKRSTRVRRLRALSRSATRRFAST